MLRHDRAVRQVVRLLTRTRYAIMLWMLSTFHHDIETTPFAHTHHRHADVLPTPLVSRKHLLYLSVIQGVGPALVSGLINFAIACAMYRTVSGEIRIWPLNKHTIAGDLGVTVIIQSIVSTIIASILVRADVRMKREKPFSRPWPDVDWWYEQRGMMKWLGRAFCFLSLDRDITESRGLRYFLQNLFILALQGFAISTLYFPVYWPVAIAIIAPLYGSRDLHGTWIPPIIKAVFGASLSLFMNPFLAALVLGAEAYKPTQPKSELPSSTLRTQMTETPTFSTFLTQPTIPSPVHLLKETQTDIS